MNDSVQYKVIEGFPDYSIGTDGTILSKKHTKGYIKTFQGAQGYYYAYLYNNGKRHILRLHRLVAQAFIPNPENLPCVNHIDEDVSNNNYTNLEWCSYSYNRSYGTCEERRRKTMSKQFKIAQYSDKGDLIQVWDNCSVAGRALGLTTGNQINYSILHPKYKSKGYYWRKIQNDIVESHIDI